MENIMSIKKPEGDLTNKLIIENLKIITTDMRMVKHALFKMMKDIDYCVTQGDVIAQILEESNIAGKDEIPALVEEVMEDREAQVKTLFDDILEQVKGVAKEDSELEELKKLLKNSSTTPGEA